MPCIPDSRHWLRSFSVELGFWILIVSGCTDFLSRIPVIKAPNSGFHKQKFCRISDSLIWGEKTLEIKGQEIKDKPPWRNNGLICKCKISDLTAHSVGSRNTLWRILSFFFTKDVQQARYVLYIFLTSLRIENVYTTRRNWITFNRILVLLGKF